MYVYDVCVCVAQCALVCALVCVSVCVSVFVSDTEGMRDGWREESEAICVQTGACHFGCAPSLRFLHTGDITAGPSLTVTSPRGSRPYKATHTHTRTHTQTHTRAYTHMHRQQPSCYNSFNMSILMIELPSIGIIDLCIYTHMYIMYVHTQTHNELTRYIYTLLIQHTS